MGLNPACKCNFNRIIMGRAIQAPHAPTPPHSAAALRPGPIPGRAKTKTRALRLPAPARGSGRFREQRAPTWHSRAAICRLSLAFRDSKHKVNRAPSHRALAGCFFFQTAALGTVIAVIGTVVAIVGISITIRSSLVQLAPACRTHIVDLGRGLFERPFRRRDREDRVGVRR
jgi:hypothetical protein